MEGKQENIATKKKRKRVSKKSKRSWRKHIDLKDIEDHLDEVRRQERQGGVISLKENEALYFVDKDTTEDDKDTDTKNEVKKIPRKSQRNCPKVFKDFYVKPIAGKKRKTKTKTNKSKRSTPDESSEEEEKTAVINNQHDEQQKASGYDLWSSHGFKTDATVEDQHYLKSTKKHCVKQPKTAYQVRGKAPAIAVCHPGASYNPTLEDHQSLLMTACHVEIVKEKEIQRIQRKLQLPPEEELAKLPSWEEEMSQGLFDQGETSQNTVDETESSDDDGEMLPSGKSKSRKTAKEKRKGIERKREERSVHILRKAKTKENDVFRVKNLKKEIRQADEKTKQRQVKKHEKSIEASQKPQRLGRQKFEEMNIEIQLTSELTGSLRRLKPEGNLFEDRYKNLQRRNIIEPRKPIAPHRKYSLKEYQKRSFKNYDLQEKLREKRKKVGRT